ncbi:MAG: S-adenosylmethionine:tRNA ribosyltransferase-isomerase, partial [Micromonosporaceae bacterium]
MIATQPNTTRPDATRPDANRPDATWPNTTQPDATRPDANRPRVSFALPDELHAPAPAEARGLPRDGVRLLVATSTVEHARFRDLGRFLDPGDLLVVNTSGTLPAAIDGTRAAPATSPPTRPAPHSAAPDET